MYVFFRLFKALILAHFAPRISILDTAVTPMRVWFNDLDVNLHANNGRYLTLMDIGRFDLSWRSGLLQAAIKRRWYPVLGSAHIIFRRSLMPFQKFELHTRLLWWDEKWFYMEQNFIANGELCARALVRGVFRHKNKSIPIPVILDAIGEAPYYPERPAVIDHWVALESALAGSDQSAPSGSRR